MGVRARPGDPLRRSASGDGRNEPGHDGGATVHDRLDSSAKAGPQVVQHFVGRWRERIDDGDTAPGEAVLYVLRQKRTTTGFGGSRENDCVPGRQMMIDSNAECPAQYCFG